MNYSQVTVDILQNPKYAGAIDSVSWLTDWIDSGFGMVITVVAFLIILVAMFKNVLAAAYCAFPKFWDRVDAAHKEVESVGWIKQFKDTFITKDVNAGSFSNAIMRILPNVKSFTDFEGDTVRPKTYFIRAIPQMFMCIIIGAFIYNGYYRDAAAKVVDFGSEIVSRVLLEVDPIAVYDQFTGSAGRPEFLTDNSLIPREQLVNKLASNAYTAVIGEYNDINSAEAKRALATLLETEMGNWVTRLEGFNPTYTDGYSWEHVIRVSLGLGELDISSLEGGQTNADGTVVQYALQLPISSLNLSSTINVGQPVYLRIRVNFEKQAVSSGSHNVSDLLLNLSNSGTTTVPAQSNLLPKSGTYTANSASGGTMTVTITDSSGARTISASLVSGSASETFELEGSGIVVVDAANPGRRHYIKFITMGGSGILSSPTEGRSDITWDTTNLGVVVTGAAATSGDSGASEVE